ncbi:MAG: RNA recognition motif domain-containing protein [Thiohalomonadales bacterium]
MKKMFVGGLPHNANEKSVTELFSEYGKVRSIELISDIFSGKCKGFGFVEMEGHEARAAIAGLNGKSMGERNLIVKYEDTSKKGKGGRRR